METVSCNLCGTAEAEPELTLQDRFTQEWFRLVRCANCGLLYLNPRPTAGEIGRYYPTEYEPHRVNGASEQWHHDRMRGIQLDFVEAHAPERGRLLDVGCATGDFLATARSRGWEVTGIELMAAAAAVARRRHRLTVRIGPAEEELFAADQFDAITMWDVLEHLHDPAGVLQKCHQALSDEGLLIFAIPNLESYDRHLFGADWVGWEAPRHLYLFEPDTVARMMVRTGFELVDAQCLLGGKGAFQISLDTRTKGTAVAPLIDKIEPLLLAALWPYRQFSYWRKKGPVITYAARKQTNK